MTTLQVAELTGASLRQLQWWDEKGYVRPRIDHGDRFWDDGDVRRVRLIVALKKAGFSLPRTIAILDSPGWRDDLPWLVVPVRPEAGVNQYAEPGSAMRFAAGQTGPVFVVQLRPAIPPQRESGVTNKDAWRQPQR